MNRANTNSQQLASEIAACLCVRLLGLQPLFAWDSDPQRVGELGMA